MAVNPPTNAGDGREAGSIPGSGRLPGEGNGNPLQYSCLENPVDSEVWWAMVHGVAESDMTEDLCPIQKIIISQLNNMFYALLPLTLHFIFIKISS